MPGVLLLGACYTYAPPRGISPEVGSYVQIHLFKDVMDSLTLQLGPGAAYVEGVVVADDSTGLQLGVTRVEGQANAGSAWSGERFTFPHGTYSAIQERRLNVTGSVLLGGLAIGAVVGLRNAFESSGANSRQTGGSTVPPQ